ncbi:hypothetical protein MMC10_003824 [Thelotrema lepadinum]|nr:hypothetical protein [Thelotrema lepadinum]
MPSDLENDLILIVCASGKQASKLLPVISKQYSRLRLQVGSEASVQRLSKVYPSAEIVQADLYDRNAVRALFHGVTAAYYVGPSFHPHETECGFNAIDAAVDEQKATNGNFKHFIYSSVLQTQLRKMMNHDCKRYVEEYLFESGLPYTVLKPCNLLDTFPIQALIGQEKPVYNAPWNPEIPSSVLTLDDFAAATARVLTEREEHFFAEYPLCSTLPLRYKELALAAGRALGKPVIVHSATFENFVAARLAGFGGSSAGVPISDGVERMILYYSRHGVCGNPHVLEMLLGRKATTVGEWMAKQLQ